MMIDAKKFDQELSDLEHALRGRIDEMARKYPIEKDLRAMNQAKRELPNGTVREWLQRANDIKEAM